MNVLPAVLPFTNTFLLDKSNRHLNACLKNVKSSKGIKTPSAYLRNYSNFQNDCDIGH